MNKNTLTLGIPTEVSLYHPIEYLELDKKVGAFLDLGLQTLKGGTKNQLLIAHLVQFVQENGVKALEGLPRFKPEYLIVLNEKCKNKGINLVELRDQPFDLNLGKVKLLADATSVYQSDDPFDRSSNIYSSSNYSMFNFLEFNRDIAMSHVQDIRRSILINGILSFPLMLQTDCIDGEMKYYIADGQHRFWAFKLLGLPIRFTLYQKQSSGPMTVYDIIRLIASVNNTSRKWGIHNYMKAWKSIKAREYVKISEVYERTKIPISTLLQAYSGKARPRATALFMDGVYEMTDEKNGDKYVQYLEELKPVMNKSSGFQTALLNLFRQTSEYDNQKMKDVLIKVKNTHVFSTKDVEILSDLKKIYQQVA